jgi:hypothetical protein
MKFCGRITQSNVTGVMRFQTVMQIFREAHVKCFTLLSLCKI